jgi:hypothetical protein
MKSNLLEKLILNVDSLRPITRRLVSPPTDYQYLPFIWQKGFYRMMDYNELQKQLRFANIKEDNETYLFI